MSVSGEPQGIDWARLKEPFRPWEVEWRVGRAGKNDRGIWAKVLAYITARAIQERLDEVFGVDGWKNEYREGPNGGVICRIWFRGDDGEWHWKEDGAENTDIEAVKGGLSGALKRAGAVLGIGRYLYGLDEGWATVHEGGEHYARLPKDKGGDSFRWDPPELPSWALPDDMGESEDGPRSETILAIHNSLDQLDTLNAERGEKARAYYKRHGDEIKATEESAQAFLTGLETKVIEEKSNTKKEAVPA